MDITKRLQELDPTLELHNEGNWKDPYIAATGYSSFNDAGIETETGEFLYAMVRLLKPNFVLETGTHWGIGTSYMGIALRDNHKGKLDTVEFLPEIYAKANERFKKIGLLGENPGEQIVNSYLIDAKNFDPGDKKYKLILIDTEPQTRFAEFLKFYPYLEEGGFIFIHDLHQHMHQIDNLEHGFAWPYGKLPEEIEDLVKRDQIRPFHFETPRGLTGFYKVHKEDYKWI